MARITIDEFRGANVQLSRRNLSCNSQIIGIGPSVTTRREAGARSAVSCSANRLVGVLLVLLCFLHFAEASFTRVTEFPRVAAEHTIEAREWKLSCHQVDRATEIYNSCRNGGESCWSCLDLDTSKSDKSQPFFLQSTSSYGRSQASFESDAVLGKFTLGEFRERVSHQFGKRFGPIDEEESQTKDVSGYREAQHWRLVDIETVCIRDPTILSVVSTVKSDHNSLHLEESSWSWRCNSKLGTDLGAQKTKSDEAEAGASAKRDSTKLESTFSSDLGTKTLSFHKMRHIRTWTDSVLLQILEAIDGELLHADREFSRNNHGRWTSTKMGRRMLISDSWKPVIVLDSVVVGIGFFLALSALSCWVWQWRAIIKSDGDRHRQSALPYTAVSPTVDRSSASPRRRPFSDTDSTGSRSRSVTEPGRVRRTQSADARFLALSPRNSGRYTQAKGGPGRWEEVPEEDEEAVPLRGEPGAVPERGPGREPDIQEEVRRNGPRATPGSSGSWTEEEGPGRGPQVPDERQGRGLPAAEEEGRGGGSPITGQASTDRSRVTEDEATVHRSSPSRYRAEPFCFPGLVAATRGFHEQNKLGEGSFGTVYRGLLFDGREVAIKRADRNNLEKALVNKQNSFRAELDVMSRLHHKHLVNLVGYCDDCGEMMLVYEYMPNGTLSDHLHNKRFQSRALFSWKVRIRVALQAARGIEYLHTYAEPPVIHRDIKSSNILLDAKGSVRVSDFGLCLIFPSSSTDDGEEEEGRQHFTTNAAGTIGYMDPEYYCHRHLTTKSDVYSFGVVILELLTGRWAIYKRNNSQVTVVEYAVPAIEADNVASILDPRVQVVSRNEFAAIKVLAEVGLQAVRRRGKDRPSMTEIIRRLEHAVTLCRSRHAPIPVFGADIGSSTDPSLSALSHSRPSSGPSDTDRLGPQLFRSDPGPAAPGTPPSHESVKGVIKEESESEERDLSSGTVVAQFGSVLPSRSQVHPILEEFFELRDIHPKGNHDHRVDDEEHVGNHPKGDHDRVDDDDKHFDIHLKGSYDRVDDSEHLDDHLNHPSKVVDIQIYNDFPWPLDSHEELLRQARISTSRSDGSVSTLPVIDISASAIPGCQDGGPLSTPPGSSSWERLPPERPETLRERWQRATSRLTLIRSPENFVRSDRPSGDGALPPGGSFYSCEGGDGGSAAASLLASDVPLDFYSAMVVEDPLLDRRTGPVMAGFTNFSELGPAEDVNYPLRPPPQLFSQGKREIGGHGRVLGHGEEPSYGLGPSQVFNGSLECGEGSADDYTSDAEVDIHEFVDEFPEEQAGSAAYAGFSNFSVLQDLDDLMKALQTLKAEAAHGQETVEQ